MLQRSETLKTFPQIKWDHRDNLDLITMIQALEEFWKKISISCKYWISPIFARKLSVF